jgi:hypothetical protein
MAGNIHGVVRVVRIAENRHIINIVNHKAWLSMPLKPHILSYTVICYIMLLKIKYNKAKKEIFNRYEDAEYMNRCVFAGQYQ